MAAKAAARIGFIREIRGSNSFHAGERIFASLPPMAADGRRNFNANEGGMEREWKRIHCSEFVSFASFVVRSLFDAEMCRWGKNFNANENEWNANGRESISKTPPTPTEQGESSRRPDPP
jgi:hypothetical protein